jgi:hypothetical protein
VVDSANSVLTALPSVLELIDASAAGSTASAVASRSRSELVSSDLPVITRQSCCREVPAWRANRCLETPRSMRESRALSEWGELRRAFREARFEQCFR